MNQFTIDPIALETELQAELTEKIEEMKQANKIKLEKTIKINELINQLNKDIADTTGEIIKEIDDISIMNSYCPTGYDPDFVLTLKAQPNARTAIDLMSKFPLERLLMVKEGCTSFIGQSQLPSYKDTQKQGANISINNCKQNICIRISPNFIEKIEATASISVNGLTVSIVCPIKATSELRVVGETVTLPGETLYKNVRLISEIKDLLPNEIKWSTGQKYLNDFTIY